MRFREVKGHAQGHTELREDAGIPTRACFICLIPKPLSPSLCLWKETLNNYLAPEHKDRASFYPIRWPQCELGAHLGGVCLLFKQMWVFFVVFFNVCFLAFLSFKNLSQMLSRGFLSAQTCLFSCHWQGIWKKHLHSEQLPQPMPNKPWNVG